MPVALIIVCFGLGVGLMGLGAFFLWRCFWRKRSVSGAVLLALLPVLLVMGVALLAGQVEVAVSVLLGTIASHLCLIGLIALLWRVRLQRRDGWTLLWLLLGLLVIMVAGFREQVGLYSGLALFTVGLVVGGQKLGKVKLIKPYHCVLWRWLIFVAVVLSLVVGMWLALLKTSTVVAVCHLPFGRLAVVLIAPLLSCVGMFGAGVKPKRPLAMAHYMRGLLWASVILITVGFGLLVVCCGGVRLSLTMSEVVLPWVSGMAVVCGVALFLPKKTARWWGGLIAVMFLVLVINLLR
ncbi:MAG: hypothetical protein J6B20_01420 [Clostridia bacterium]|nr:hypothetical protein [Clostridia bacterium]